MKTLVAVVCALVIALYSEKCLSLEYTLENSGNVVDYLKNKDLSSLVKKQNGPIHPVINTLSDKTEDEQETHDEIEGNKRRRVVRQAYQGQTSLYPNLSSGPSYGQQPYSNYNNQNPSYNTQWQNPYNNQHQPGYAPPSNGYQPSYNNPFGSNQPPQYNNNQPTYTNGYAPVNYTQYNPSPPYGHNSNPNPWQPNYPSSNGQRPYNSTNGNYPPNNVLNPYPGYKPANPSLRPPYHQPVQFQNNSHAGYLPQNPGNRPTTPYPYNPYQRPNYYPSQSQVNNTRYPQVVPGNQHPVIHDDSTKRPGQNPYVSNNASYWSGYPLNNTQARPPYNYPSGQNNPYFNNPVSPGYGTQNSNYPYNTPNQRPPYQNPSNNYPGQSLDSPTFNLANGYNNPRIPDRPTYGNGAQYFGNSPSSINSAPNQFMFPNGTLHDPSKVSPNLFNSY